MTTNEAQCWTGLHKVVKIKVMLQCNVGAALLLQMELLKGTQWQSSSYRQCIQVSRCPAAGAFICIPVPLSQACHKHVSKSLKHCHLTWCIFAIKHGLSGGPCNAILFISVQITMEKKPLDEHAWQWLKYALQICHLNLESPLTPKKNSHPCGRLKNTPQLLGWHCIWFLGLCSGTHAN